MTSLDAYKNGALHWQAVEWTNDTGAALVQSLLKTAVDNGYNGTTGFTRTQNNKNLSSSLTFRSEKLPTVSKTVAGILGTSGLTEAYRTYKPGMTAVVGETVYFKIDVTTYEATNLITYTNVTLKDTMTDRSGYSFWEKKVDTKETEKDITETINGDGLKGGTHTYYVGYKLKPDDLDTDITNDVSLTFDYQAQYSKGKFNGSADANAKISAASFAPQDIVIDFGLPVTIDYSKSHGSYNLSSGTALHGKVTVTNNQVTYTPKKDFLKAASDTVTLKNEKGLGYTFKVIPASNVLYEDGFLSNDEDGNLAAWNGGGSTTGTQAKMQTAGDSSVYGYTAAYDKETGVSGTAYQATVTANDSFTNDLSFSFKGTGFDIIGTCGPNTGTVLVRVEKGTTFVKGYLVNTALKDANLDTIYQVPLVHEQALPYDTYDVTIIGAYVDYGPSTQTMAAALSLNDGAAVNTADQIYDLMEAAGISEEEMENVELIDMDQLYGTATMAAQSTAATDAPTGASGSMTVAIDAFRVYDESNTNQQYYADSEKNVKYVNVLDATLSGNAFKAYVEGNEAGEWTQTNYEANGGPQNEVYLGKGQAIAFKVDTSDPIQISARAVSDTAQLVVNGVTVQRELTSNTEMYYEVTADDHGIITIKNGETGMLALGNLKLPAGTGTPALTTADEEIVLSLLSMDPAPAFAPKLSAAARSFKVIRNKLVTVTVHASTDVARLTINGKTVSPTNGLLVKRGWSKEYIYLFTDTVKRDVSKTYEIVAYNADGTASAPVQVTG